MTKTQRRETRSAPASPLDRLARRSALMILAERLWRLVVALGTLGCAFLALSWAGLWINLEAGPRVVGAACFFAAAFFLIVRELSRGAPKRAAALARLDIADESGLRPATALQDTLAQNKPDAATATLWELHRRRLWRALARVDVAPPQPETPRHDPYALRALALVAAVAAAFVAGPEKGARLAAAFDWRAAEKDGVAMRLDAWLDPPPYTGRASMVLTEQDKNEPREAPINSILHLRNGARARVEGGLTEIKETGEKSGEERRFKLTGEARLFTPVGAFSFTTIPDLPPTIDFTANPHNTLHGSMRLGYKTDDDYGVVSVKALFERPPNAPPALFPPPELTLALPKEHGGRGEAQATLDLADHPWAGGLAILRLEALDEGGNAALTQPVVVTMPQRRFRNPLARVLAEQRRKLVFEPDSADKVHIVIDALALAPELFDTPSSIYLGLREAQRLLDGNRHGEQRLRDAADLLWAMALSLEGADMLQHERELNAARERLREALARGADDKEIAQLQQELQEAIDKYLESAQRAHSRDQDAAEGQEGGREISREDLEKMLQEMQEANKNGDTERAQALLDQLSDILENLQTGPSRSKSHGKQDQRAHALSELDSLAREQQQLRDETYRSGARAGRNADRQRDLRERLERMREALRRSEDGAPSELDEAEKAMRDAEQAMGQGERGDKAVEAQGRALQSLRQGADELARRAENGEEGQEGENDKGKPGRDPLGREIGKGSNQNSRARYDANGAPPTLRAQRVLEELRRRLGQPERGEEELNYLERLLKR